MTRMDQNEMRAMRGMPQSVRLSDLLGLAAWRMKLRKPTLKKRWTRQMVEARIALVCACLALALQCFALALTLLRVFGNAESQLSARAHVLEAAYLLLPEWVCSTPIEPPTIRPEQCRQAARPQR